MQIDNAVSIITVSFNAVSTIERTIRSVLDQSDPQIEYIVIDGGSTDGTAELISAYESSLSQWRSEPDYGIADAMNKGLARAKGRYVLYLNADDYLIDSQSIATVRQSLHGDLIAAPIVKREADNTERLVHPRGFNWWHNFKTGLFHQSTFCARQILVDIGGFDTQLCTTMDYDLFLRAYRLGFAVRFVDRPFSVMTSGGVSTQNNRDSLRRRLAEEKKIHFRYCPNTLMKVIYSLYWEVYPHYRLLRATHE